MADQLVFNLHPVGWWGDVEARPRWRGAWFEGWCTDIVLQCTPSWPGIGCEPREGRCVCKQEDLHEMRDRRYGCKERPLDEKIQYVAGRVRSSTPVRAWRTRGVGGEPGTMHDEKNPLPGRIRPDIEWFLANGWKGAAVQVKQRPKGKQFTLYHPTGATLRLIPGTVEE